jgi:16S rRNA (guanine527-N7)-methyltransferase
LTLPFLRVGGIAVLQRGDLSEGERNAAADAALVLGARLEEERLEEAPSRRRVLLVRKIAPTGQRFPRRAGVPAKRPLCAEPPDD